MLPSTSGASTLTDCDLVTNIRAGDVAAFDLIYARHHASVFATGRKLLNDDHGAEDLAQSVFLTIWRSAHLFRGGSFPAWLTTITINRARSVLRSRASADMRLSALAADAPTERPFTDELFARFEALRMREALQHLPDHERALIQLGFFEYRTHAELARITGIPLGTVKTRIRAGLNRMRAELELRDESARDARRIVGQRGREA